MRRDPTQFRERFKRWKEGLPVYKNGKVVDDEEFESFRQTLPDNQKQATDYRTRRYWELNGKPKTFSEAIGKGMYTLGNSGKYGQYGIEIPSWHANSVAYDSNTGNYEFMKLNSHPTRWMEDVYGYWSPDNLDFRENYKLEKGVVYDKYVPRKNVWKLPKFADGKDPNGDTESLDAKNYLYSFINSPGFSRIGNNNYLSAKRDYPRSTLLLNVLSYITPTKTIGPSYNNAHIEEYKKDALKLKYVDVRKHKEGYPSYSYHNYNYKTKENSVDLYGDRVPEYSEYDPFFTKSFVEGHELRHALMNNNVDPYSKSLLKDLDWGHDNKLNEKLSDVFGLRYLLYKEGIYDSRENKDVTPEQINKLRKKYPKLRPLLKTKDDSRVSFLLNNVFASNSQQKRQYEKYKS